MAELERQALDTYIRDNKVEEVAQELVECLLQAKPDNPREWLLNRLEQDLSEESEELSESSLHKLFAVTRRITAEIVPQDTIQIIISETLQLLHCDMVSLFILDRRSGLLRLYASNMERPIVTTPGQGIVGSVFSSKETVNILDCYKDSRFDKSFDVESGYVTRSLIAVPLIDFDGSCSGVLQAINKKPDDVSKCKQDSSTAVHFGRHDQKILQHLAQHVSIAVRNAEVYREAIASSERATGLLNTIQSLSQDLGAQSLLLTITMHASKIVSAERSTVFVVDGFNNQLWSVSTDTGQEICVSRTAGIAGLCCQEGQLINIPDAYADSRFNQEVDKKTGFKTQSILAIPVFGAYSPGLTVRPPVVGVIQMINKVSFDGHLECFDEADVEIMELFAKFIGPKLEDSSTLARRRPSDVKAAKEGELALGFQVDALSKADASPTVLKTRSARFHFCDEIQEEEEEDDQ